jgi:hypothetical protein
LPTCFAKTILCDRLPVCQQEPTLSQNEPRPSVLAIVAAVCLANALSCFNAIVVAFGHFGIMIPKAYLFLSCWCRATENTTNAADAVLDFLGNCGRFFGLRLHPHAETEKGR